MAALLVTVACEAAGQVVPAAGGGVLVGPWQAAPFPVAGPILAAIDQACRASMPEFPQRVQLTVVDARGGGRIQAHYTSGDGAEATCMDMSVDAAGNVEAIGGGSVGFGGQAPPPLPTSWPTPAAWARIDRVLRTGAPASASAG